MPGIARGASLQRLDGIFPQTMKTGLGGFRVNWVNRRPLPTNAQSALTPFEHQLSVHLSVLQY